MTEERIAALEKLADDALDEREALLDIDVFFAIAYELRALRLMLREEIREAAWAVKVTAADRVYQAIQPEPIASRKAPEARKDEADWKRRNEA